MKFFASGHTASRAAGSCTVDRHRGIRIEEYQGQVELSDVKSVVQEVSSDPSCSTDFHRLIDFGRATLDLSANDVLRLALVLRHELGRTQGWLVFVASNTTTYGVVRMLGYWSRVTGRMRIFPSREEAESWLDHHIHQMPAGFIHEDDFESPTLLRKVG